MWIRVQDKSMIVNASIIEITKGLTKKSKVCLFAKTTSTANEVGVTLGVYDTLEMAESVFSDIEQAILNGKKIFIMPSCE